MPSQHFKAMKGRVIQKALNFLVHYQRQKASIDSNIEAGVYEGKKYEGILARLTKGIRLMGFRVDDLKTAKDQPTIHWIESELPMIDDMVYNVEPEPKSV